MSEKKGQSEQTEAAASNGKASNSINIPECFVLMPISDPEGYEQGHFAQVFDDLFAPACDRAGYRAIRADQVRQTNLIHLDVLQKIVESPMALCDLSNRNPNVMFELGLRQAFDKPVVLVQETGTPAIFDITPLRYTEYHREMLYRQVIEDQEKITTAIIATREAIKNSKSINSIVKLLSLTHAASLTNISESDKDTALFQVILAELSNLKTDIAKIKTPADERLIRLEQPLSMDERQARDKRTIVRIESLIQSVRSKIKLAQGGAKSVLPDLYVTIKRTKQLAKESLNQVVLHVDEIRLQELLDELEHAEVECVALSEK